MKKIQGPEKNNTQYLLDYGNNCIVFK